MERKNIEYIKSLYGTEKSDIEHLSYLENLSEKEAEKLEKISDEFISQHLNKDILKAIVNLYIAQLKQSDIKRAYAINKKLEKEHSNKRVTVEHGQVNYIK